MPYPTVLIAEDSVLIQEAMRLLLHQEFEIAAVVEDGEAAIREALVSRPDVLLLDLSLPLANGFEVIERLHNAGSSARVVFVSAYSDAGLVERAFELGARGYVLKSTMHGELVPAVREAIGGGVYRSAAIRAFAERRPRQQTGMAG